MNSHQFLPFTVSRLVPGTKKLHHVRHASSSPSSSSVTSSLFKMAAVDVSIARRDVTANWNFISRLPASAEKVTFGERSSDRPETIPACSGDPPDSIASTSPRIWRTSYISASRGRRFVCSLPSSSFSKIPLLVRVVRSSQHLFHTLCGHSCCPGVGLGEGFSQDLNSITLWYFPEKT